MAVILLNDGLDQDMINQLKHDHEVINQHVDYQALLEKIKHVDIIVIRSKTTIDQAIIDAAAMQKDSN